MVKKGAIIRVDFDAWTADGDLFDTTSKDVAKKHDRFNENAPYGPMPVVAGAGRVLPGFDQALLAAEVGKETEVTVPPEEAFGERDAAKVETVPLRDFLKQDVEPHPGMRVSYKEKSGTVTSVTAGRVRIDYNPPLAGKTLKYRFTIREELEGGVDAVKALIDADYGLDRSSGFEVQVTDDVAEIKIPDSCKYDQRWFVAKYRLVSDLRNYGNVKTVRFIEEYTSEAPDLSGLGIQPSPDAESGSEGASEGPEAAESPAPEAEARTPETGADADRQ